MTYCTVHAYGLIDYSQSLTHTLPLSHSLNQAKLTQSKAHSLTHSKQTTLAVGRSLGTHSLTHSLTQSVSESVSRLIDRECASRRSMNQSNSLHELTNSQSAAVSRSQSAAVRQAGRQCPLSALTPLRSQLLAPAPTPLPHEPPS
mgnify:CR=1 FL=1